VSTATKTGKSRALVFWSTGMAVVCAGALLLGSRLSAKAAAAQPPDEPPSDAVGAIEGDSIAVQGPMTVRVENGEVKTILRSGSDVRVKSGRAKIELVEGGQIAICGPAHLSVLKSGPALTVALDSGTIHARINNEPALTVYTAQIQAQPIAIGGGTQDVLVGFDSPSVMCIRARSGAMRLEQQLTGQGVVLPQAGNILLSNGALTGFRPGTGHCSCEWQVAKSTPPPPNPEASVIASAKDIRPKPMRNKNTPEPAAPAIESQEPVYQVFMPPLRYDAKAKVQDEPDPRMILLVRRVRVRPTLILEGEVTGDPVVASIAPTPSVPELTPRNTTAEGSKNAPAQGESVMDRVKSFFHKLWSKSSS
jgi:hypothetical protein